MKIIHFFSILTFTLTSVFAAPVFARDFSMCENRDILLDILENLETDLVYSHFIAITQKSGGVPLLAPANKSVDSKTGTTVYRTDLADLSLSISTNGKGKLRISGGTVELQCLASPAELK